MAQILKFQEGGAINDSQWGTFTMDGIVYEMTDDNKQLLYNHAKKLNGDERYQMSFIIDALKSGKNLIYENNQLTGDVTFDVSDHQKEKMQKKVARGIGKGKHARQAISSLDNLKLKKIVPDKKSLLFKDRYVEYELNDVGDFILDDKNNKKYIKGANNQEIIDFLRSIEKFSVYPEDFDIIGIDQNSQWIRDWYLSYGKDNFDSLINRIETGEWTENDKEVLNDFHIFLGQKPSSNQKKLKQEKEQEETAALAKKIQDTQYQDAGYNPANNNFEFDPQSNTFTLTDPNALQFISNFGNVWLNENFIKRYPQFGPLLSGYPNGLFYINGQFYNADDTRLYNNPIFQQFVNDNKVNPGSNTYITQTFDDAPNDWWRPLQEYKGKRYYSKYDNVIIRDITGNYQLNPITIENGISITPKYLFQVKPTEPSSNMYDNFGQLKPEHLTYAVIDDDGDWYTLNDGSQYVSSLKPQVTNITKTYYDTVPEYLSEYWKSSDNKRMLIKVSDSIYKDVVSGRYIILQKLTNGKSRAVWMNEQFQPNMLNPFEKDGSGRYKYFSYKNGKIALADLSPFNLTDKNGITMNKKGGKILKADGGVKLGPIEGNTELVRSWNEWVQNFNYNDIYHQPVPLLIPEKWKTDAELFAEIAHERSREASGLTKYDIDVEPHNVNIWDHREQNAQRKKELYNQISLNDLLNYEDPKSSRSDELKSYYGGKEPKSSRFSISESIGLLRLANAIASSKRSKDIVDKYTEKMERNINAMQAPQKKYPIFTESPENHLIDAQIQQELNKKYVYSDPTMVEAFRDKDDAKINYLRAQKAANQSASINKYKSDFVQVDDANTEARVNLYNNKLSALNELLQMKQQSDVASSAKVATSLNEYGLEQQDDFKKYEDKYNETVNLVKNQKYYTEYKNALLQAFNNLGGESKLDDESKKTFQTQGFQPYMLRQIDPTTYDQITQYYMTYMKVNEINNPGNWKFGLYRNIPLAKKGHKLSKLTPHLAINQNKVLYESDKISKEVTKIFSKLIK